MIVIMTINFNCNRSCVFSPSLTAIVIVTATVIMTATVHDCDYGCHCNCDCGCDSFDCHCDCEFNRYSFVIYFFSNSHRARQALLSHCQYMKNAVPLEEESDVK